MITESRINLIKEDFDRDGFVIVDFGFPAPLIEEVSEFIQSHQFVIPPHVADRVRKRINQDGHYHGMRIQDAWKFNNAVKQLARYPQVLRTLEALYQKKPLPFQTLNFPVGTQQRGHSDAAHFNCWPNDGSMCGVWVALQDITEDNGPLIYYPGSHQWPELYPVNFGITPGPEEKNKFAKKFDTFVRSLGIKPQRALLKKGQAVIWAANLIHGGG